MRRWLLLAWMAVASGVVAPAAGAQQVVTSVAPDGVAVTIYRAPERDAGTAMNLDWLQGYALITERRTIAVPAGPAVLRFEGVAAGMLPESAIVTGLPAGVREKNLDADLLSPRNLYARGFGRPVTLRRMHAATGNIREERAVIRSGADGAIIVQTAQGFEAASCGPLAESLVYDGVPPGLPARPTLSVATEAAAPAQVTVTLSYLAWGFDWQTNYVVRMREDGRRADLTAWVTLANSDSTSFADAETAVVAGKVNREDERGYSRRSGESLVLRCFFRPVTEMPGVPAPAPPMAWASEGDIVVTGTRVQRSAFAASAPITVIGEELGDLKLYRVPIPTTVAANAQKQIAMYDKPGVRVWVVYRSEIEDGGSTEVIQTLRTRNRTAEGLGVPLPAGPVAVFEPLAGESMLAGLGHVADRAVGEEVEIDVAVATQVSVEVEETGNDEALGRGWRVTVRNANPWPIAFEGMIHLDEADEVLERSSAKLARKNGRPLWRRRVGANDSATLTYRIRDID